MTIKHFSIAAILAISAAGVAQADDYQTEFRLLGPAFSKHFGKTGEPVLAKAFTANDGRNVLTNPLPLGGGSSPALPGDTAASYCNRPIATQEWKDACRNQLSQPVDVPMQRKSYNETHLELGIEYNRRNSVGVERYFVSAVVDSYYQKSAFFGAGYQWTLYETPALRLDAGIMGMAWNRSVQDVNYDLKRRWLVTAMPVMSIEMKEWGVSLNVSYAPRITRHGQAMNAADTIIAQLSWKL